MTAAATPAEIQQIIAHRRHLLCNVTWTLRQVDEPHPVLIVEPFGDFDATDVRLWARVFGADEPHHRTWSDKTHGQRVDEWFCSWRGWHVQIIGRIQVGVPATAARGLVLAGGAL